MPLLTTGAGAYAAAAGAALDAATTAWVSAVVTAGGSVSGTQQTRVNDLIVALKAASLWVTNGKLDRLWLYAGESVAQQAAIDIVSLGQHTVSGSPTFGAGGYTGGSPAYINPGVNNNGMTNFGQVSGGCSMGCYSRTDEAGGAFTAMGGAANNTFDFAPKLLSNYWRGLVGTYGLVDVTPNTDTSQGLITVTADNSEVLLYRNAISLGSATPGGALGFDAYPIYILARNSGAGADQYSSKQLACAFFGGKLTPTNVTNLNSAIQAYMTAWGVNI